MEAQALGEAAADGDGDGDGDGVRMVLGAFRWVLVPFVVLAVGATLALYVNTGHTEDDFAWTIAPDLTAALLGAAYGGTIVFFAMALRQRVWANFRMVLPAPFVLSCLMLVATLMHVDRFHLDGGEPVAVGVAWIWLVVYLVVPPAIVGLTWWQLRQPGTDPPRRRRLPVGLRVAVGLFGFSGVVVGLVLFVAPGRVAPHWPWPITPLTGRVLAAWLAALGVAGLQAVLEDDVRRVRVGLSALAVMGGLGLLAVARYGDDVTVWWPGGALLVAVLALMAVAGGYGVLLDRRVGAEDRPLS